MLTKQEYEELLATKITQEFKKYFGEKGKGPYARLMNAIKYRDEKIDRNSKRTDEIEIYIERHKKFHKAVRTLPWAAIIAASLTLIGSIINAFVTFGG